jgi:RNA polymerase sigma factor (sigma-70 family)
VQITDAAVFLEEHLPLVERVLGEVARRRRVTGDALDELRSLVFLKLIDHDYAVLRQFEGASTLRTYLAVVLERVLLDQRNRLWGRWRPSSEARRLGRHAMRLERLVARDGFSPDEAAAAVGLDGVCATFIDALAARAPFRGSRAVLGEDAVPEVIDPSPDPEHLAWLADVARDAAGLRRRAREALEALDPEDHLILTLRYRDGLSIADVARVMNLEAKPLYRRIARILGRLRAGLAAGGNVAGAPTEGWCDLVAGESGWWRPSNPLDDATAEARERPPAARMSRGRLPGRVHRRLDGAPAAAPRTASL